jgi:predicted enzyme related to lactoylglutathione lyase
MKVTSASPILQVTDLEKALNFYSEVLGFSREFVYGEPPYYAGVKMNEVILHLNASKENASRRGCGSVYLFCDEVDGYYEKVREKGAQITSALETWPYGMRDFQMKDLDGNLLCFGCSTGNEANAEPVATANELAQPAILAGASSLDRTWLLDENGVPIRSWLISNVRAKT